MKSSLCTLSLLFAGVAFGQMAPAPNTYGTGAEIVMNISNESFTPFLSITEWATANSSRFVTNNGGCCLSMSVILPAGALITAIAEEACDASPTGSMQLYLIRCPRTPDGSLTPSGCTTVVDTTTGDAAAPNCGVFRSAAIAHTVDNNNNAYVLETYNPDELFGAATFRAARIFYKLQVKPSPAVATFADVPLGSPLNKFVEALFASGITAGCGNGNYCPNDPITRGQMAVFLASALGLHWAP